MTVKKLIEELKKYEEVIGSCIQEVSNDEDEIIEKIVSLYDY